MASKLLWQQQLIDYLFFPLTSAHPSWLLIYHLCLCYLFPQQVGCSQRFRDLLVLLVCCRVWNQCDRRRLSLCSPGQVGPLEFFFFFLLVFGTLVQVSSCPHYCYCSQSNLIASCFHSHSNHLAHFHINPLQLLSVFFFFNLHCPKTCSCFPLPIVISGYTSCANQPIIYLVWVFHPS